MLHRFARPLLRFAFHLFYNPLAFTYDWVSAIVSRGRWRAWTRAAIPRIAGTRILEVPAGTGNLLLDLVAAGYAPVAVDLSPAMLRITRGKIVETLHTSPRSEAEWDATSLPGLVRARAQALPFHSGAFDTIIMTFPPEFIFDPRTFVEFSRLLDEGGRVVWVDAGRLLPRDLWGRALNAALDAVGGGGQFEPMARELLTRAGFHARIEWVQDESSRVAVVIGQKTASGK